MTTEVEVKEVKEIKDSNEERKAVENLSDDGIKWRAKYKETKSELETIRLQVEKEKQDLSNKVDMTFRERQIVEKKWVEAEMKAQAIAAGIKDIDLVKLIDVSKLKISENGIEGLQEAVNEFKSQKPDFFGAEKKFSSSTNANIPDRTKPKQTSARDMSDAEWQIAKQRMQFGGRLY